MFDGIAEHEVPDCDCFLFFVFLRNCLFFYLFLFNYFYLTT